MKLVAETSVPLLGSQVETIAFALGTGCLLGDRAFARARAAGKNATEAGHARAKAGVDFALRLPA